MRKGKNNNIDRELQLLLENYGEGTFRTFMAKAKESFSKYGKVLTNSFGVVLGDSLYLAKLTFSPLKAGSTYDKWSRENNSRREKQLEAIRTNSDALLEGGTDIALLLCPIAPHIMLTDKILRNASLQDKGVQAFVEESGLINIPGVSGLYKFMRGEDVFDGGTGADWSSDRGIEEFHEKIFGSDKNEDNSGIIGKAWDITQKIFLLDFTESYDPHGNVLLEGEEGTKKSSGVAKRTEPVDFDINIVKNAKIPSNIESLEDYIAWATSLYVREAAPDASEYLKARDQLKSQIIESTKSLLQAYCKITVSTNKDELFQALGMLNDRLDKKVDLAKIQSDVDSALEKAVKSEKVKNEWLELDPKNKEKGQEEFSSYVQNGLLITAKGKLVPQIKPMFEDTQDILKDEIMEGATPELIAQFEKYDELKPLAEQMKKHLAEVKNTIEPILEQENL